MLERYLKRRGIDAEIVTLAGAVEIAPRLGRADLICDLVSTGSTLQANHLREVEVVLESHAALIRTPIELQTAKDEWVERLLMRIDGVQQVRESKYIMLHAPRAALAEIRRLLPGSESPTIIALLVEKFDPVSAEYHVSSAHFWRSPLPMSQSQGMPIEIHDQGGRKFLWPCAGELKTA